jgi:hypothetical protein
MVTRKKEQPTRERAAKRRSERKSDAANREKVQVEGDDRSAREFNEDERAFDAPHAGKLGRWAAPEDPSEAADLHSAEHRGMARARPDPDTDVENNAIDRDPDDDVAETDR